VLRELSWDPARAVSIDEARAILADVRLAWSADLDEDRLRSLDPVALQVWVVPANPRFPVRGVPHKLTVAGNVLGLGIALDQQVGNDLVEARGGVVLIDLVCDAVLDLSNRRPVSAALGAVLFGQVEAAVPGGLMRLGLRVRV
jgi:hypothetical protein